MVCGQLVAVSCSGLNKQAEYPLIFKHTVLYFVFKLPNKTLKVSLHWTRSNKKRSSPTFASGR